MADRSISSAPPAAPVSGDVILGVQGGRLVQFAWALFDPAAVREALDAALATAQSQAQQSTDNAALTAADRAQTGLDRIATGGDRTQTGLDRTATGQDRANTGLDRIATAADRVQTGVDRLQTGADRTAADGSATNALNASLTAVAQAGLASIMALSAASVAQQDLSATVAAALHRSPAAIVATALYQPRTDSDGGAWLRKCQSTSWYNRALNGAWIPHPNFNGIQSELVARALGGTLVSTNLMAAANAVAGWSVTGGTLALAPNNRLRLSNGAGAGQMRWTVALTSGKTYVIHADLLMGGSTTSAPSLRISNDNGGSWTALAFTTAAAGVFTASVTGNHLVEFGNQNSNNSAAFYIDVGNIALQEVTAFAPSGSFYPSAVDGKFYRLWKNRVQYPADFTNAVWAQNAIQSITSRADGVGDLIVPTTANVVHRITQAVGLNGGPNSWTVRAKPGGYSWIYLLLNGGSGAFFNVSTGAIGTVSAGYAATIAPAADAPGYYDCTVTNTTGANFGNSSCYVYFVAADNTFAFAADGVSGVYLAKAQLEVSSTFTGWETAKTVTDNGQAETFDGNTAQPPEDWAIVAEASRTIIYALDQPGRPMWMVCAGGVNTSALGWLVAASVSTIAVRDGKLVVGGNGMGAVIFDFARDDMRLIYSGSFSLSKRRIADRNSANSFTAGGDGIAVATGVINFVSMYTMPDAPVEPSTGLQVPTLAVLDNTNLSIVQNDGLVVGGAFAGTSVTFNQYIMWTTRSGSVGNYYLLLPGRQRTAPTFTLLNNAQAPDFSEGSNSGLARIILAGRGTLGRIPGNTARLSLMRMNEAVLGAGLAAQITDTSNTGWMPGDIRRCLIADTLVGALNGLELVTNGTFDTDVSGWTTSNCTLTWQAGGTARMALTATGPAYFTRAVTVEVGKSYVVSGNILAGTTAGTRYVVVGTTPGTFGVSGNAGTASTGLVRQIIVATQTTLYVSGYTSANAGDTVDYDNISLREVVVDRSYKGAFTPQLTGGLVAFGTGLVRAQVGAGSQLTAISGFSATSYLQEAYNADLDFGTGSFIVAPACSIPANPQLTQNLMPKSNLFGATSGWQQDGLTVAEADLTTGGRTYAKLQQPVATTGGNRIYQFAAITPSPARSNVSWYVHRVAASTDKLNISVASPWSPAGTVVYDPVTQTLSGAFATSFTVTVLDVDTVRLSFISQASVSAGSYTQFQVLRASDSAAFGGGTGGVHVAQAQQTLGDALLAYEDVPGAVTIRNHPLVERSAAAGARWGVGIGGDGFLMGEVYDGTTTRTVRSTASYISAGFILPSLRYETSGSLTLWVGPTQVAQATGNPLLTMNNASAVLTIGRNFAGTSWFPGSISITDIGATVPGADASRWMYEQEKEMFRDGAQVTLPDSGAVTDLDYDPQEDKWKPVSAANESAFVGLVRVSAAPVPAGSFTKVSHRNGTKLLARSTTNPGVDVTVPAKNLKEELLRRGEDAKAAGRPVLPLDYSGGCTGTTTLNSALVSVVANLTLPPGATIEGARVTGTGIPANTTVLAYNASAATMQLSAPVTSGAAGTQINFLDFILPTGLEITAAYVAGLRKQEGVLNAYTRGFNGFRETEQWPVASPPGNTAVVQFDARRMYQ